MKYFIPIAEFLRKFQIYLRVVGHQLTIPGFNYVMDPAKPLCQRSMFGLILLCIMGITVMLMVQAYNYSQTHTIITNIESLQYPLSNLTYPAVYICNLNRISLKNFNQVLDGWILPNNITREEAMEELKSLPAMAFKMKMTPNYNSIHKILTMNNVSLSSLMYQLSDSCEDFLKVCRWRKRLYLCNQLFSKVVSVDGFCCAFNNYPYRTKQHNLFRKVRIATSSLYSDYLIVTLKMNQSDYFSSLSSSYGFAVYVKNPYLYPDSSEIGKLIPANTSILVSFLAAKLFSTPAVKELPDYLRECSRSDRYLSAFQQYSYHNCVIECRVNMTVRLCNCVPLIFPRTSDDQRICEIGDLPCLNYHSEIFKGINHGITPEFKDGHFVVKQKLNANEYLKRSPCNCLPECSRTIFQADAAYTPFDQSKKFKQNKTGTYIQLFVYAQDIISTRIRRDTYYNLSVLLGVYGGLVGFFLGLSIICLIELFYIFILHPTFILLKRNLFKYNEDTSESTTSEISVVPSLFIVGQNYDDQDIRLQKSVERYNKRLKRIMRYKNASKTFHTKFIQEWLN